MKTNIKHPLPDNEQLIKQLRTEFIPHCKRIDEDDKDLIAALVLEAVWKADLTASSGVGIAESFATVNGIKFCATANVMNGEICLYREFK